MTTFSARDISHARSFPTGSAGNGLFATKDIPAGEAIIYINQPLLAVPDSPRLRDTCSNCFQGSLWREDDSTDLTLKACTSCKIVRYCGKACQSQAWKHHHKHECKIFSKLYPNVLPNTVRMVVQLLLLRKANVLPDSDWDSFMKLQHHLDDFRKPADGQTTWETIQLMSKAAKEYSGTPEPLDLIESMTGRLLINSLTLVSPTYEPLGLCLDPFPALANHSCAPNAVVSYDGPHLSVRSLSPIPHSTEITISYIDITNPVPVRRSELQTRYFFTCACPECTHNTTLHLPDLLPGPSLAALETQALSLRLTAKQQQEQQQNPAAALSTLSSALALFTPYLKSGSFPPHRQPYPHLHHQALLAALAARQWTKALTHSLYIYFHIDPVLFAQPFHPLRVVHKWVLAKLVLHVCALGVGGGDGGVNVRAESGPGVLEAESGDEDIRPFTKNWGIDWVLVASGLVEEVKGDVGRSHGEGSVFARVVGREGEEVGANGGANERRREALEREWMKLKDLAAGEMGFV